MTEEHSCTEECIEELEGIIEDIEDERNELSCRVQELENENQRLKKLEVVCDPDFILKMAGRVVQLQEELEECKEGRKSERS